jgi:type II secretion system protein N
MMDRRRLLRMTGLLVAGLLLFPYLVYLSIPVGRINTIISRQLESQGLSLSPGAHKTIIPGLAWDNLLLSSAQGALVSSDRLEIQLRLAPLLTGRIRLGAAATVRDGHLDLEYGVTGKNVLTVHADGIDLADIPFFATILSAKARGNLWIDGSVTREKQVLNGEMKLEVKQLGFSGVKLGAFPLPDAENLRTQGMIRITGGKVLLESFTLQGEGLYMRISGDLPGGDNALTAPISLVLEIMPKPEVMEKQKLVFMLLTKFMVSPGNFRVPITGTLLKPVIL